MFILVFPENMGVPFDHFAAYRRKNIRQAEFIIGFRNGRMEKHLK